MEKNAQHPVFADELKWKKSAIFFCRLKNNAYFCGAKGTVRSLFTLPQKQMIIANKLKESNRAEYLLYMWQVEGIIRLYGCDIDRIDREYLNRFDVPATTAAEMRQWYGDLCEMMRSEGKQEAGHLQICENVIIGLADLNAALLESEKFPYYKQMYYRVLPYVVELRARNNKEESASESASTDEFRLLFEVLYGVMMLRLQQKEVSPETQRAAQDISALLGQLSDYWKADRAGELKLDC